MFHQGQAVLCRLGNPPTGKTKPTTAKGRVLAIEDSGTGQPRWDIVTVRFAKHAHLHDEGRTWRTLYAAALKACLTL